MNNHIALRDSTKEDFEFIFLLNKTNMRKYVKQTREWDEEKERDDMCEKFTPGIDKIVQYDGRDIGVFRVIDNGSSFHLSNMGLLPEFQGKGIGTFLIKQLLLEGKMVTLRVAKKNPAVELYKRLGFKITGEADLKYNMSIS